MVQLDPQVRTPPVLQSPRRDDLTIDPVDQPQPERRVLLIINNMGGGGAERVVATVANYLHRTLKWTVTILTLEPGPVRYQLVPGVESDPFTVRISPQVSGTCSACLSWRWNWLGSCAGIQWTR